LFSPFHHGGSCIDSHHGRNVPKTDKKSHPGAIATAEIDTMHPSADRRFFRQIHGRLKTPDMDLFSHDQFPQIAFRSAIDALYGFQSNIRFVFIVGFLPLGK
jgi:hypothetical protein